MITIVRSCFPFELLFSSFGIQLPLASCLSLHHFILPLPCSLFLSVLTHGCLTWLRHRDGQRIRPSRKHTFSLDEDGLATLVICNADYTDGGIYTCTAKNEMGNIESMCRVSVSCTDSDLVSRRRVPVW